MKNKSGFTLVELIVVITILGILSTIGFISYSGYLSGVRDTNRLSQLKSIGDGLNTYKVKYSLPLPEDYVEVRVNNKVIGYQGYLGKSILGKIGYSSEGVDPKTKEYFSYYLTQNKKYYQLMGFAENEDSLASLLQSPKALAIDYSILYPIVSGTKLGILTDELNTPIQEVSTIKTNGYIDLATTNANTLVSAHIETNKKYTFSGSILVNKIATLSDPGKYGPPKYCPEGFIGSWGDAGFNQKGFCVAKYEMTYEDADTPNSNGGGTDWNTVSYISGKKIVSIKGKYPIADIEQIKSIEACKSMGDGYHLITNNEWMSITRQIEMEINNWSSGNIGIGNLYIGVSNNITLGCDKTGGNTEPRNYATKTGPGVDINCNNRRKQLLFNGEEIWDIAGNVWEHVNKANTINGSNYNNGQTSLSGSSNGTARDDDGIYLLSDMNKYGSLFSLGKNNGMGNIYYADGKINNIFLRGARAGSSSDSGIFTLRLSRYGTTKDRGAGFRCTYIK